jgi:hypothetical protein
MNGSDKQIEWANQIITNFVAKCETVKLAMNDRIATYDKRAAKCLARGQEAPVDFAALTADTMAEIAVVDLAVAIAKSATNANMIIGLKHLLEKPTADTEWDSITLSNIKLILKEGTI